jgi:hypothetical protein
MRLALYCSVLLGLLVGPALAGTIDVYVVPASQSVDISAGTATVQLVADIPVTDPLIGFGLDLDLIGTSVTYGGAVVDGVFDPAYAPDGDGLAGLTRIPPGYIAGNGIVLATITLNLVDLGITQLMPGYTVGDVFEGLMTPAGLATGAFHAGQIEVTPEPAALALLGLGLLLRRR